MQVELDSYIDGAGVATDLVNTAPEVRRAGDALPDPAALQRFLTARDLHLAALAGRAPTAADLAAVHALRAALRAILDESEPAAAAAGAAALLGPAGTAPTLAHDGERWHWRVAARPGVGVAGELAVLTATALLAVIRTLGPDRFRGCAATDCDGAFVDTSRSGRRRYCEPELCGNRVNVAKHRARRRAEATG